MSYPGRADRFSWSSPDDYDYTSGRDAGSSPDPSRPVESSHSTGRDNFSRAGLPTASSPSDAPEARERRLAEAGRQVSGRSRRRPRAS